MTWKNARAGVIATTLLAILAVLGGAGAAFAQASATDVRLGRRPDGVRVVIDSSTPVRSALATNRDDRLTLSLSGLEGGADLTGAGIGLVRAWRLEPWRGDSRLVLELKTSAVVVHRFSIPPGVDSSHWRYVIDIAPPGEASAAVIAAAVPGRRRLKVVVIDAGHGGKDPGAQAGGIDEKDITLATALDLRRSLEESGRYKVVMTRTTDVFVSLEERVRIARRAHADLFIALHADSAGADAGAHGASVYTLSDHGETRVAQVLNGHEWFDRGAVRSDPTVRGILIDLTQRTTLNRSSRFAQLLINRLGERIDLLPGTHRDAGYFVLLAPDVPAVLLEMGFITCPADRARLTDPVQQRRLAEAISESIDSYFDGEVKVASR